MAQDLHVSDHLKLGCSVRMAWGSTLHMGLATECLDPVGHQSHGSSA